MSSSTTWPNQHVASERLLPKLLGLLGLLFVLLLLVLLLLKRKHEKKQIIPGRQTSNKHENDPQKEAPKEKSNTEVQAVNSVSGVDVNNKHTASVIAGVQQVNEIPPKDLPELTYCSQEISNIYASTSQLFTEDWESVKNKGVTSKQEKATCDDGPSSVVFENQSTGVLDYGTVSNSKALAMSSFQNQAGSDVTKWNRNGNGKPVGTIIPLPKMATDNNVNPDDNLAITTTVVSSRHDVVRNSLAREKLNKEVSGELYDSSISLMNSVTERQRGKESEMPEQNGSQGNIAQVETRVVDDRRRESRLKNDENSMKCSSGVGNPTSLIRGDLSTTKRVKRGQISSEAVILSGSRRGPVTPNNETAVNTSSPTKGDLPWGSDYGYVNLLHEIVENQGRRTRERWKQSHRFKITHQV
ncbi:uncharacterized protein LOC127581955 [Pristis pectinata]|uniref:uncharacterized protein LOC127581955 n=1 Tax=Pristis pectinata TaxID=685728 RepID=UPI00223DE6E1|nr:uncharacterized protein LOC127581955 [Pristis pectinata]